MSKIYIFLADGFEEIEGLTSVDILRRAGEDVCTVSIMGRREIAGSHKILLQADTLFEENDYEDGDLFMLPGGMPGTKHLGAFKPLTDLLVKKFEEGRHIAAICAAPSVLGGLGILKGKKATCFPGWESALEGAQVVKEKAVTDGNVTTGLGMGASVPFALELVRVLQGQESAEKIGRSIMYLL